MNLQSIIEKISASPDQLKCLKSVMDSTRNIIVNSSSGKIKKTIPAGSLAKKTILNGRLELDCVYIIEKHGWYYEDLLDEIYTVIRKSSYKIQNIQKKNHSLNFVFEKRIGRISIDILPAFEINSPKQMAAVKNKDAYIGSTSIWHLKYMNEQKKKNPYFIDIVKIIKYWKYKYKIPLSSFTIELVVANAIEQTRDDGDYIEYLEIAFRVLQSFLDGAAMLPVNWNAFSEDDITAVYSMNNLLLVDPADPSENIAKEITEEEIIQTRKKVGKAIFLVKANELEKLLWC